MTLPDINLLLGALVERQASDLYLTHGTPPSLRINDHILPLGDAPLDDAGLDACIAQLLNERQREEFASTLELNTALIRGDKARFRINVFRQQSHSAVVVRRISMHIPTFEELGLPPVYGDLIMLKRG